jgi:hypothetical protein
MRGTFISLLMLFQITSVQAKTAAEYATELKALSHQELFDRAKAGKVGKCYVFDATTCKQNGNCACDMYTQSRKVTTSQHVGLPGKNNLQYGTGCTYTPSTQSCWGSPNTYVPSTMCTSDKVVNASNMIRAALNASGDLCDLAPYLASLSDSRSVDIDKAFKNGLVYFGLKDKKYDPEVCFVKNLIGSQSAPTSFQPTKKQCLAFARVARVQNPKYFSEEVTQASAAESANMASYYGAMRGETVHHIYGQWYIAENGWALAAMDVRLSDLAYFMSQASPNQTLINAINSDLTKLKAKIVDQAVATIVYDYINSVSSQISTDKLAYFMKLPTDAGFIQPNYTIKDFPTSGLTLQYNPATKQLYGTGVAPSKYLKFDKAEAFAPMSAN